MTCPIEPAGEYLLVSAPVGEPRSPGGIILPASAQVLQSIGTVLAVGPKVDPLFPFRVGDAVFYHCGSWWFNVAVGGAKFVAVHQSHIFARVRPQAPEGVPEGMA